MDKELLRLIIIGIGLLVMAGIYWFDPNRTKRREHADLFDFRDDEHFLNDVQEQESEDIDVPSDFAPSSPSEQLELDASEPSYSVIDPLPDNSPQTTRAAPLIKTEEEPRSAHSELLSELMASDNFFDTEESESAVYPRNVMFNGDYEDSFMLEPMTDPDPDVDHLGAETQERPTIIMFYIVSDEESTYEGADLSRAFGMAGLQYGAMELFHYMDDDNQHPLFSISNMLEPGVFPAHLNHFECKGLILFMQPLMSDSPLAVYDQLISCIDILHQELGGKVLDDKRQPAAQAYLDQHRQWLS